MTTFSGNFFRIMEADQKDITFKQFAMVGLLFPQLFQRRPSTKAYEDGLRIGALGTFRVKNEGAPVFMDDPVQGLQVRTVHQVFALGWRATHELMINDQHGVMNQMSADLGESARDHMERTAWDVINDGYAGNRHTGLENEVLFSSTHTRLKAGGTWSNILAPAMELSQTGLEAVMNLASTTTSDEGRFIRMQMKLLVVHPNNQHNAYVLLNTEFKPGSGNNDRSTVVSSRSGLMVLGEKGQGVPYLSSTRRWSVHAGPGQNGLTWNDREELEFWQAPDADTRDRKHYAAYHASAMLREQRNNYGSGAL